MTGFKVSDRFEKRILDDSYDKRRNRRLDFTKKGHDYGVYNRDKSFVLVFRQQIFTNVHSWDVKNNLLYLKRSKDGVVVKHYYPIGKGDEILIFENMEELDKVYGIVNISDNAKKESINININDISKVKNQIFEGKSKMEARYDQD